MGALKDVSLAVNFPCKSNVSIYILNNRNMAQLLDSASVAHQHRLLLHEGLPWRGLQYSSNVQSWPRNAFNDWGERSSIHSTHALHDTIWISAYLKGQTKLTLELDHDNSDICCTFFYIVFKLLLMWFRVFFLNSFSLLLLSFKVLKSIGY